MCISGRYFMKALYVQWLTDMYSTSSSYCQGKPYLSAAAMPHNIVSRSPLEEGKHRSQDSIVVHHRPSTCPSAASAKRWARNRTNPARTCLWEG
jgi:hypothetical protein